MNPTQKKLVNLWRAEVRQAKSNIQTSKAILLGRAKRRLKDPMVPVLGPSLIVAGIVLALCLELFSFLVYAAFKLL